MALNEVTITRAIVETYTKKFLAHIDVDVAVVGGGPAGLVAAYFLAKAGRRSPSTSASSASAAACGAAG